MPNYQQIYEFLDSIQWNRIAKKELIDIFGKFFNDGTEFKVSLSDLTVEDCKDIDYSVGVSVEKEKEHYDFEIYYLKMRNRKILITGSEFLEYYEK